VLSAAFFRKVPEYVDVNAWLHVSWTADEDVQRSFRERALM